MSKIYDVKIPDGKTLQMELKERYEYEYCPEGAHVIMYFMSGEEYNGIYRGEVDNDIILEGIRTGTRIGIPQKYLTHFLQEINHTGSGNRHYMKKFSVQLSVIDAETGITTAREQPAVELTQENVNDGLKKLSELTGVLENLSDEDVISCCLTIEEEDTDTQPAVLLINAVKKKEIMHVAQMVQTAFSQMQQQTQTPQTPVEENTVPVTDTPIPADETVGDVSDETPATDTPEANQTDNAPEGDEQPN